LNVPQSYIEQGFTLDALVAQMQQDESAQVTSAQDLGGGNYRIAFKWTEPEKFFGAESITVNPDGTVTIDLGDLSSFETLTVHVQGNVLQTAGEKTANDTAVFKGSSAGTITFKPSGALPSISPTPSASETPPSSGTPFSSPAPSSTQTPKPSPTATSAPSGGLSTTWIIIIAFGALFVLAIIVLLVSLSARKRRPPQAGYPYPPPPPPQAGPAPGYMFCPNCGKQIPVGTKFCTYCGFQIGAPPPPPQQQPPSPPPETPQS
ncbi:MAG: zinc-ribbon domain-containing protein, partial [bacterium]